MKRAIIGHHAGRGAKSHCESNSKIDKVAVLL
jgi:hypothetical protein